MAQIDRGLSIGEGCRREISIKHSLKLSWQRKRTFAKRAKNQITEDDGIPSFPKWDKSSEEYRENWARLIQKIYEVDPPTCPKCGEIMRIIRFVEDREVIKAILKHRGLWHGKSRLIPKV